MTSVKVYDIVSSDGRTMDEVTLHMLSEYEWTDIFDEVEKIYGTEIESYSYERLAE